MEKLCYNFSDIVGHKNIVRYLEQRIQTDTLNDVVLLQGSTGIGKSSIAKILACEVAYRNCEDKSVKEFAKQKVIKEKENTQEVMVYNMSVLKDDSAVQEVMANLNLGFTTTGRKVIIMDEAHGLTKDQQDFLLTSLEKLQVGVYVIICTTDTSGFRDALIGRCKTNLRLNRLTEVEIKSLIKAYIEENKLKFEMPTSSIISIISSYTGNEPRSALNLLSNFESESLVQTRDLEVFINVDECEQVVQLVKYLYKPVIVGIQYLEDMHTEHTFIRSMIEVTKCALGAPTTRLKRDSVMFLRQLVEEYGDENLVGFCMDIAAASSITKNRIIGYFIKWNYESRNLLKGNKVPVKVSADTTVQQDVGAMKETLEKIETSGYSSKVISPVQSLAAMLCEGEDMV